MMPLQRACDAENQARNKLSNGPLRAQSKTSVKYSATCGHTSVAGDMLVSCQGLRHGSRIKVAPRIVFLLFVLGRRYLSAKDDFCYMEVDFMILLTKRWRP